MIKRVISRRRQLPKLYNEFSIDFKFKVRGPGITEDEAKAYILECIRYATGAFLFDVHHPTGENDVHGRDRHNKAGGISVIDLRATRARE